MKNKMEAAMKSIATPLNARLGNDQARSVLLGGLSLRALRLLALAFAYRKGTKALVPVQAYAALFSVLPTSAYLAVQDAARELSGFEWFDQVLYKKGGVVLTFTPEAATEASVTTCFTLVPLGQLSALQTSKLFRTYFALHSWRNNHKFNIRTEDVRRLADIPATMSNWKACYAFRKVVDRLATTTNVAAEVRFQKLSDYDYVQVQFIPNLPLPEIADEVALSEPLYLPSHEEIPYDIANIMSDDLPYDIEAQATVRVSPAPTPKVLPVPELLVQFQAVLDNGQAEPLIKGMVKAIQTKCETDMASTELPAGIPVSVRQVEARLRTDLSGISQGLGRYAKDATGWMLNTMMSVHREATARTRGVTI